MKARYLLALALCALSCLSGATGETLTAQQKNWLSHAWRHNQKGWIFLHIEGSARERGFQHGYLLAHEIADDLRKSSVAWTHQTALPWSWLAAKAARMFTKKIDPEDLAEIDGIVAGMEAAGVHTTRADMIAYNGSIELEGYWWPEEFKKLKQNAKLPPTRESCSAFIATGDMTRDGNVVLGHNTMSGYYDPLPDVIIDIVPSHGHRILMQTEPGWIHSGSDFFITDAGLVGAETTIGGFSGFDSKGIPEFVRMRRATQDANSIEQWCHIMERGNNGGYANAWLLGDIHSHQIARLELGLKRVAFQKKSNGYFTGSNIAVDLTLLRWETDASDTDIRLSSVARRVRWHQLMKRYAGKIDLRLAKRFEADHYDTYLKKYRPDSRTLDGHFELDSLALDPWPGVPFSPTGSLDAKVVDARMASKMSFAARWGSACGMAFKAHRFLEEHPQFDWMRNILDSRPSEPWTDVRVENHP